MARGWPLHSAARQVFHYITRKAFCQGFSAEKNKKYFSQNS